MRPYNPLARLFSTLDRIETALADSSRREISMANALDHISASVAATKTLDASILKLVSGLAQQIREKSGDPVALEALANDLDAQNATLAAAVVANTPVAPAGLGSGPVAPPASAVEGFRDVASHFMAGGSTLPPDAAGTDDGKTAE